MSFFDGSGFADLLNATTATTDSLTVGQLTLLNQDPNAVLITDPNSNVIDLVLANGQIIIGQTGTNPIANTLTGTANQVNVTNGSGTITLSTPQDIDVTSSVTFGNITDAGVTNSLLCTHETGLIQPCIISNNNGTNSIYASGTLSFDMTQNLSTSGDPTFTNITDSSLTSSLVSSNSGLLQDTTISNSNGCQTTFSGSTLNVSMTQDLDIGSNPSFSQPFITGITSGSILMTAPISKQVVGITATDGSFPIGGTFDGYYTSGNLTGSSNINVTNGSHSIAIDTVQPIQTTASVTFGNITDSSLGSTLVSTSTGLLQTTNISNTNANGNTSTLSFSGNTLTLASTMSQDLQTTSSPTFSNITTTSIPGFQLVSTNASNRLISTTIGSNNGVTSSGISGAILNIDTPQDIRSTSIPRFSGLTLNGTLQYSTGTVSQSGTTITGSGTTFTAAMAGGLFYPVGGTVCIINTFNSATSLTAYTSQTVTAGTSYVIFYSLTNPGFAVSPNGNMYLMTASAGGASTTGVTLQLQPNGGGASYNIDVNTYNSPYTRPANGRMQFTDNSFGANFGYWSKIQGSDTNALQRLLFVNANGTVSTLNNTLDTTSNGNANLIGTVTCGNIIDSGLTANTLVGNNGSKQLQSVTVSNSNGANGSYSGGVLTFSNQQDLSSIGSVQFNVVNANSVLATDTFFYPSKINAAYTTSSAISVNDLLSRFIQFTTNVAGVTLTFPLGSSIETAISGFTTPYNGMSWDVLFWNFNTNGVILANNTGISFQIMNTTQPGSTARLYRMIRTSASNYTVYNMS